MTDKFAAFVVRFRWPVIVLFVAITAAVASRIPGAEIDAEMKSQLPADLPARLDLDRVEELFGGTDMVLLAYTADDVLARDTLKRLKTLSRKVERVKQVDRVLSLFTLKDIRSEDGTLVVDPAVKRLPRGDEARDKLREELRANEMVYGNVVSKDFKATAIIGMLKASAEDKETIDALKALIAETDLPAGEQIHLAGMPFVRVKVSGDIQGDLRRFLPLGLLIMLVFLFVCFRQLRGVILPFIVVVMAIAFGMGLIPLLGWKIQMITVMLPVILIAVANDYGIHVLARYQEENLPGSTRTAGDLARSVTRHLFYPVVATGVTTMAGLLCLLSHIVVPAKQLGILSASAVAFALLGSLTFVPAWLAVLWKSKPVVGLQEGSGKRRLLERLLHASAGLVARRPRMLLVGAILVCGLVATGIARLVVDTDPMNYYEQDAPIVQASRLVDRSFGGSAALSVVTQGNIKDPDVLRRIDAMEKKLAALPEVGQTSSIAKIVRQMNRVLDEDSQNPDRIPATAEAVAQYFLLYSMSGEPEDFDRIVDFNYEHALLTARLNTLSVASINRVLDFARAEVEQAPEGLFPVVGGFVGVLGQIAVAIVQGQIVSLLLSLLLVGLLVALLFRSLVAGLYAIFPLGLAMGLLFGLMGYLGIELNIATAMLSSIMIGVGVDYTIHYLWRYREERSNGVASAEAVHVTLTTTGRGIVFNALSVIIGFVVVLLSNFMPVKFLGFLVVVSIGACMVGSLGLLPALCLVLRPNFLEPATDDKKKND